MDRHGQWSGLVRTNRCPPNQMKGQNRQKGTTGLPIAAGPPYFDPFLLVIFLATELS
jgi:hypothetical protein